MAFYCTFYIEQYGQFAGLIGLENRVWFPWLCRTKRFEIHKFYMDPDPTFSQTDRNPDPIIFSFGTLLRGEQINLKQS